MSTIGDLVAGSRKIVIKIGSNTLSDEGGRVNHMAMHNIVEQLMELMRQGKQVVIVSSGAGICGMGAINKFSRKGDMNYKQALCAIGQVELMMAYKELFKEYGYHVAQLLLTSGDFADHIRNLHIRNALFTLVDMGVVPIVNENDSVGVDEIRIGDNDTLGALTANLWGADMLVMLSDIDGVFNKNPQCNADAKLIEEIYDVEKVTETIEMTGTNKFGTGGIATKMRAARMVNEFGIPMVLLNGKKEDILRKAISGEERGTVFFGLR